MSRTRSPILSPAQCSSPASPMCDTSPPSPIPLSHV